MPIHSPPRIALVDDDPLVRLVVAETLRDAGFDVIEHGDADEAWSYFSEEDEIDMMISDVRMPGSMDGIDLIERVRSHDPRVKTMLVSGWTDHRLSGEIDAFIRKPFDVGHLVGTVSTMLAEGERSPDKSG